MSWNENITARSFIYLDEEGASDVVDGIRAAVKQLPGHWTVREQTFEEAGGCVRISIKAGGDTHGAPRSAIDDAMKAIDTLGGRSGGVVIWESDFGVDGYELLGAARARGVGLPDARGFTWRFEDTLELHVTMPASEWRNALGGKEGTLADLIESTDVGALRTAVFPGFFESIEGRAGEIAFEHHDIEPYLPDGDYDDGEQVTAIYNLDGHELSGEAFETMLEAFGRDGETLGRLGAQAVLRFCNAKAEDGASSNIVFDCDNLALLEFTSSDNAISDIRVQVIDGC